MLETLSRGDIIQAGESIDIEYTVNETETPVNRLNIVITGPGSDIIEEMDIEEEPLSGWVNPVEFDETAPEGLYTIRFDFYSDDEIIYSEIREFFIAAAIGGIRSIASYPPVLYPGGGGLFHAETDAGCDNCWLRWSLDDDVIAEGAGSDGYGSIEIEAPGAEGVYNLSLEIFPFAPEEGKTWDFESSIKKEIPLYVNTEQKSGVNEFEDSASFFSLFHFRGNLLNSADPAISGIEDLTPVGLPALAVRNGMFGYYLDGGTSFETRALGLPLLEGSFEGFSVMISLIPFGLSSIGEEPAELYLAGLEDGSFTLGVYAYSDGRLKTEMTINGEIYSALSSEPVLIDNVYSSVIMGFQPEEGALKLFFYADGTPAGETVFSAGGEAAPWLEFSVDGKASYSRLSAGMEILIDEFGIYRKLTEDGNVVDPQQFERSMELQYGKSLMYAEGFDEEPGDIITNGSGVMVSNSSLTIPPGEEAVFPPLYPGYEEVMFRIEIDDSYSGNGEAVFYVDNGGALIASVGFPSIKELENILEFSLIFDQDSISISTVDGQVDETGFSDDFSGVGYSIRNNSPENNLVIESILVIRKHIISNDQLSEVSGKQLFSSKSITEDKNKS